MSSVSTLLMAPLALPRSTCSGMSVGGLRPGGRLGLGSRELRQTRGLSRSRSSKVTQAHPLAAQDADERSNWMKSRRTSLQSEGCLDRLPWGANLCLRPLR
jgi:hypothetical protein